MKTKQLTILSLLTVLILTVCLCGCPNSGGGMSSGDDLNPNGQNQFNPGLSEYSVSVAELDETLAGLLNNKVKKFTVKITNTAPDLSDVAKPFNNSNCNRRDITLDLSACTGVTEIEDEAFYNAYITRIILPEGLEEIGKKAFYTTLESVVIPSTLNFIDSNAFSNCTSLKSFSVAEANKKYFSTDDGVMLTSNKMTMYVPQGFAGTLTIPMETVTVSAGYSSVFTNDIPLLDAVSVEEGNDIYSSVDGVLYNKDKTTLLGIPRNITEVTNIPSTVKKLAGSCCEYCSKLEELELPEGVEEIDDNAVSSCTKLNFVVVPSTVKTIGYMFLYNCKNCRTLILKPVTPPQVTIKYPFFQNCTQFEIKVPENSFSAYKNWVTSNRDYYITGYGNVITEGESKDKEKRIAQWNIIEKSLVKGPF